jgi:type VI secretion system protein ImpA
MDLDFDQLLRPITGEAPSGSDLRTESGLNSIYYQLKDARSQARIAERAAEAAGDPISIPQEWQTVRTLAIDALQKRSKDIEIAAWLCEALLRLEGFSGLAAGFTLINELVAQFWPLLYPADDDDSAGCVSPLAGLNGTSGDGALIQPIRMISLLPDSSYGTFGLWHYARVENAPSCQEANDFNLARAAVDQEAITKRAMQANAAHEAFQKLNETLIALYDIDAPPSSNIANTLDEVRDAYRNLLGGLDVGSPAYEAQVPEQDTPFDQTDITTLAARSLQGPRDITTREQALTELLRISDYFRRNEPHSPISYTLETLVFRGRMSFIELLEELMPSSEDRRQLLQHAGINLAARTGGNR